MISLLAPKHIYLLLLLVWGAFLSEAILAEAGISYQFIEGEIPNAYSSYDTELFNLLIDRKNIIDKKRYFKKGFSDQFDKLLRQSKHTQAAVSASELKRKLLSGPAGKARSFVEKQTGQQYLYFDACQAHDCGNTNLSLVFNPRANAMVARLRIKGEPEYLGNPSLLEKALINQALSELRR